MMFNPLIFQEVSEVTYGTDCFHFDWSLPAMRSPCHYLHTQERPLKAASTSTRIANNLIDKDGNSVRLNIPNSNVRQEEMPYSFE